MGIHLIKRNPAEHIVRVDTMHESSNFEGCWWRTQLLVKTRIPLVECLFTQIFNIDTNFVD